MLLDYVLAHLMSTGTRRKRTRSRLFTTRSASPPRICRSESTSRRRPDAANLPVFHPQVARLPARVTHRSCRSCSSSPTRPGQAFEQFLKDHWRLLNHLPRWRIVAVAPRHIPGLPGLRRRVPARRGRRATAASAGRNAELQRDFYFTVLDASIATTSPDVSIAGRSSSRERPVPDSPPPNSKSSFNAGRRTGRGPDEPGAKGFLAALAERRGGPRDPLPIRYDRFGTRAGIADPPPCLEDGGGVRWLRGGASTAGRKMGRDERYGAERNSVRDGRGRRVGGQVHRSLGKGGSDPLNSGPP